MFSGVQCKLYSLQCSMYCKIKSVHEVCTQDYLRFLLYNVRAVTVIFIVQCSL